METNNQALKNIDVLIQGAGIGGLTLAIGLCQNGFKVHIVERALTLSEVGAGIWMAPNALQVFQHFGLDNLATEKGWPIERFELKDYDGKILSQLDMNILKKEFGFYTSAFHRADLQKILFNSFNFFSSGSISFGVEVNSWNQLGHELEVKLSNGEIAHTKILIGADGLHSKIREKLFPESRERYSGSSSYRAIVHTPPHTKKNPHGSHQSQEIWAPGCRFGVSPISHEKTYWYMTFDAPAGQKTNALENQTHARNLAKKFFPDFFDLVEVADPSEIIRTDIFDLMPLKEWSQGRVGLVGDAAHATTPNLGQGGAQAVEDAFALVEEIKKYGLNAEALTLFFSRRKEKVNWVVQTSWNYGLLSHKSNTLIRMLRNIVLRYTPDSVRLGHFRKLYRL